MTGDHFVSLVTSRDLVRILEHCSVFCRPVFHRLNCKIVNLGDISMRNLGLNSNVDIDNCAKCCQIIMSICF